MIVEPQVKLLAHTVIDADVIGGLMDIQPESTDAETLVTFAGRSCYESWHRPRPETYRDKDYIERTIFEQHHCYDADTDVLTADGWKRWADVTNEDKFATLTSAGIIEYHQPSEIIAKPYKGKMIHVDADAIDLLVTPNHKFLACVTTTREGRKKQNFELIEAQKLHGVSHAHRKDGNLPDMPDTIGTDLAWFLGFFIGDGYLHQFGNAALFNLVKQRKIDAVLNAADRLGLESSVRDRKTDPKVKEIRVEISAQTKAMFEQCRNENDEKVIPQGLLMSMNTEECNALLNGLLDSDGCRVGTSDVFDSTSADLRGQFQQLALHCGFAANEVEGTTCEAGSEKEIGGVKFTTKATRKRLCVNRKSLRPEVNKKASTNQRVTREVQYDGMVYCATVPNHTLYVRRNGKTVWSGNSSIIEHATATLYFTGVSRAFLTELTRHRHLSFSVRSQRFVNEAGANIVLPPIYRSNNAEPGTALFKTAELLEGIAQDLDSHYEGLVEEAAIDGHKRKQAREAARAILPSMTETKMTVTGNLRAWLEVIDRRTAPDADAELQEVMGMAREALRPLAPTIFKEH